MLKLNFHSTNCTTMKTMLQIILAVLLLTPLITRAQGDYKIVLRNGTLNPEKNISENRLREINTRLVPIFKKSFVVIQFETSPTEQVRQELKAAGIELLDYVPNNAYTATVTGTLSNPSLVKSGARAVIPLSPAQKMSVALVNRTIPAHAKKVRGFVDVWVNFTKSFTVDEVQEALQSEHYEILSSVYQPYQILEIRVPEDKLEDLASKPYVQYLEPIPFPDKPNNNKSTVNGRSNVLNSALPGGRNLRGENVVVGVGDESNPLQHIDFNNRIINRAAIDSGGHGVHVMGTLAGAGIVSERYSGYAPKATIVAQHYSNIIAYASTYVQDHGMVITNNSYGNDVSDCSTFGQYNLQSYVVDFQAFQMPYLQHVFAAGNSGNVACVAPTGGMNSIIGGFQAAKNVISVGNTTFDAVISGSSSKGPVADGRIKPEISAQGTLVRSTYPFDRYATSSGTSMASPAVSGGLALLYQRYRQLHTNQNPKNALMKAILCNGGTDQGVDGPDYKYGFGWMNLLRSVSMLESNSHFNSSVATNVKNQHTIQVPANTARLKVMLYWNDPVPSTLTGKTLVNDLDLTVNNPSSIVNYPKILDPTAGNVNNPATTGADHTNNIEQVVIDSPVSGEYKIFVNGTAVNQNGQQEYFVVYDIIPVSTTLTYPIGNEHFIPKDTTYIAWDSFGNATNDFTVQYQTVTNGAWNTIPGNFTANGRQLLWMLPDVNTSQARVKIIDNVNGTESISENFTILGQPVVSLSDVQCEGYIAIDWTPVTAATDYEVMLLNGDEMVSVAATTGTHYVISGLSKENTYWFTVRARLSGNPGRRAVAKSRKPDSGTCAGTISNNDLKLEAILTPVSSGRLLTPTALSNQAEISIRIRNEDDQPFNGPVTLAYSVNSTTVTSVTPTLSIPAQTSVDYSFAAKSNFSATGNYAVEAIVAAASDPVSANNSLTKTFSQLPNNAVTLPFTDNVESAATQEKIIDIVGLDNASRYDFVNSTATGRLRTFVNTGIAYSGSKAFTMDTDRYTSTGNTNYLDGTFNLSSYNLSQDIRLNFRYKNHGQKNHPDNKVWVRGSYADNWIEAYNLYSNQNAVDQTYKLSGSIELANLLEANSQSLSTSTQIRWGQYGSMITADPVSGAGYSFDDIKLAIVTDDIQLLSTNITQASCGLTSDQPITITVRNSSDHTISNIPVNYKLGNGQEIHEFIPSINGRSSVTYTFTTHVNVGAVGTYHLKLWTSLSTDTYAENNTLEFDFYNNSLIVDFPYLQNFETSNGNWHSAGSNNSWSYGVPASTKINKAASGTKVWKTNLAGNYNNQELSYLYSPCFNLSGMTNPTLSFSVALDIEYCPNEDCDFAYVEYSTDGNTWQQLGVKGQGTNWYNKINEEKQGWSVQDYTRWHVATFALPVINDNIRLRFVLQADPGTTKEGIAIDDIHVYDNQTPIYAGATTTAPVTQNSVTPAGWVNFTQNGQMVAAINPNGQTMGTTAVQAYINGGAIRNNTEQYYLDRNITIKPAVSSLASNATVRLYFLDSEYEKLFTATGCTSCSKAASAYELGITKYTDTNKSLEDGSLSNNLTGSWNFLSAANTVKVPFDKGYYFEIQIKDFSEFWFSGTQLNQSNPLPVKLLNFTASIQNGADADQYVQLLWTTSSEVNAESFEVERAIGSDALKLGRFETIGAVDASGETTTERHYTFHDLAPAKTVENYYRLKMLDKDESFEYSRVISVTFDKKSDWRSYPNPSAGGINVLFQADSGLPVHISAFDIKGNSIKKVQITATGLEQKQIIDLSSPVFAPGIYFIEVTTGKQKKTFKVIKQ